MKMFSILDHLILWCMNLSVLVDEDSDTFFQKKTFLEFLKMLFLSRLKYNVEGMVLFLWKNKTMKEALYPHLENQWTQAGAWQLFNSCK